MFLQGAAIWHPRCGPGPNAGGGGGEDSSHYFINGFDSSTTADPHMIADRQEYSSISVKLYFKILHKFVADPPWSPATIRATPRRTTTAPLSISTSLPLAWPRPRGRAVRERRSGAATIRITTREDFPGLSLLKQSVILHECWFTLD